MAESAEQAPMTLTTQEVKAYSTLLAVHADNESYVMGKLAAAASGADTLGEVKAYLCFGIIASWLCHCCPYLIIC